MNRVHFIDSAAGSNLVLPGDIPDLDGFVKDNNISLIVVDPIISHLGKLDTHKDSDVRNGLEPLVIFAEENQVGVLGIIHHNKSTNIGSNRVSASGAFVNVSRQVLTVAKHPSDEKVRILGTTKTNYASDDTPLEYRIENAVVGSFEGKDVQAGKITWIGESKVSLQEAMSQPNQRATKPNTRAWLKQLLIDNGGKMRSSEVYDAAQEIDVSEKTVQRAKNTLDIEAVQESDGWYWTWTGANLNDGKQTFYFSEDGEDVVWG